MTSYRTLKVSSNIQYVLTQNMREVFAFDKDMLEAFITITKVELSMDLKIANCYVVQGYHSKLDPKIVLAKLNNSKYSFRKLINSNLVLKYSPEIRFFYDFTIENVDRVSEILNKIASKE